MEIRLHKNGIDPKELIIIKKALLRERTAKARKDKKQKRIMADDETTAGRRIKTNDD